jgi:Zn-dependent protease with chaperone function
VLRGLQGALFYGFPLWLIPSFYQRRLELEADAFAAQLTSKECMIASLEKLNYITNGMVSKGGDTHPSLKKRLNNILQK